MTDDRSPDRVRRGVEYPPVDYWPDDVYDPVSPDAFAELRYLKRSSALTWAPSSSRVLFSSGRNS
jgi:hypothetical protein